MNLYLITLSMWYYKTCNYEWDGWRLFSQIQQPQFSGSFRFQNYRCICHWLVPVPWLRSSRVCGRCGMACTQPHSPRAQESMASFSALCRPQFLSNNRRTVTLRRLVHETDERTQREHDGRLEAVLRSLAKARIFLNPERCKFWTEGNGSSQATESVPKEIDPDTDKTAAIEKMGGSHGRKTLRM